jgi:predicted TIM-barrel fold metal-dependent hydrolase
VTATIDRPTAGSTDRLTLISADCHAGANMAAYREYLDPAWRDEFDAWRGEYSNPFRDLQGDGRNRNWDDARRNAEQEADGVVGEVVYPNTVPPFFPTGALVARPPTDEEFPRRLAGIRAHNRWLVDFCAAFPERRAGIAQIFLNDVDEAVKDMHFAAEHGLRGGVLLPSVPDDAKHLDPLYSRRYDPIWAACEELGVVVNNHSGGGSPDYGEHQASGFVWLVETGFFSRRSLHHLIIGGVFERYPALRFVLTEQGASWIPPLLTQLDAYHGFMKRTGRVGELKFGPDDVLPSMPSEYFARNCWIGCSFPSPTEGEARHGIGLDRYLWGSDYPHHESTYPFTREGLRRAFPAASSEELRAVLGGNAAHVYGFDLDALAPLAAEVGPTLAELAEPLVEIPAEATSPAFFRA